MKKVAVVTDVVDPGFYFSTWHKYYGELFGEQNLFVICYSNSTGELGDYKLGGTTTLPCVYNDTVRAKFISSYCAALLEFYDFVIRVDVDEFLVADPRLYPNLTVYMENLRRPYVTAIGLDIIQSRDEAPLDLASKIIIHQRQYAYPNSSLNKTCIASVPTRWLEGFHFCNFFPKFNDLYLLHLKRADTAQQIAWAMKMSQAAPGDKFIADYYSAESAPIFQYRDDVFARSVFCGWDGIMRNSFRDKFVAAVNPWKMNDGTVIYSGNHFHDDILVVLPQEFKGAL